jgi:hypothetical protein
MGKWLDLAAKLEADERDNRDDRDESPPIGPNVPNVPASLPPSITNGLNQLRKMAAPNLYRPERWPLVVSDALRLARDGWAAKAMALGWDPLDVFGAVPDPHGEPAGDGLAVWLAGRKLLALTADYAVVDDVDGARSYFNRREQIGAVLLWSLGSSRSGRS